MSIKESSLLFHGTSAYSVWRSYRFAIAMIKLQNSAPIKRYLQETKSESLFTSFGPLFPSMSFNLNFTVRGRPCLTEDIKEASIFSMGYRMTPDEGRLNLINDMGRSINVSDYCDNVFGKSTKDVEDLHYSLIKSHSSFLTPGAILLINGKYMKENNLLLAPAGEEFKIAKCLPWRAIRGIIFVENFSVTGFHPRDLKISTDLNNLFFSNSTDHFPMDWRLKFLEWEKTK